MRIKEEHLDLHISSPFTGKTIYVRTMEPGLYKPFYDNGYQWLFTEEKYPTCPECDERLEDCECEDSLKKKKK